MKSLFKKLSMKKSYDLEKSSVEDRDNEVFVEKCIERTGVSQLSLASDRLKSSATFILKLVSKYPEVLKFCEKNVVDDANMPVDNMLFVYLCCEKNMNCFEFFSGQTSKQYLDLLAKGQRIQGTFNGEEIDVDMSEDKDYIDLLKYVKYNILNSKSMYVQCVGKNI